MELTNTKSHFIRLACHPYPTRSKLGRSVSRQSSFPQEVSRADDEDKDQALVSVKRRKKETHIVKLPRDIIFNILIRVPAEVLHDTVRHVCRLWYEIVRDADFVRVHRQISPAGFLIQASWSYSPQYYIDADTARLKVTKVKIPAPAKVLCRYNALVLLSDSTDVEILHVVNVVTKVKISLPPLVGLRSFPISIGFAVDSSGHYKVVYVSNKTESWQQVHMTVFTIGVDKAWRFIDLQGIPISAAAKSSILHSRPVCFGGFFYWLTPRKSYLGLALDVNTETIYQFSKPNYLVQGDHPMYVIGMGTGVGLIYTRKQFIWTVWKLTDVKSGQWTELASIDVTKLYSQFGSGLHLHITPVRLFKGDLWFYRRLSKKFIVVRYNMSNKSFEVFPFKTSPLLSSKPPSSMIFTQELLASPDL